MNPTSILIGRAAIGAGLAALLAAGLATAQQQSVPNAVRLATEEEPVRLYSVEVIVFEYVGDAASTTEIFAPDAPVPEEFDSGNADFLDEFPAEFTDGRSLAGDDMPVAIDLPAADAGDVDPEAAADFVLLPGESLEEIPTYEGASFTLIDPAEYQLRNAWDRLVKLDAYRPLMHTAWIQPAREKEVTVPLPLRRIGDPPLRLEGTFSLYLSRFLHLVVDLSLEHKSPQRMTATRERVRYFGDNQSGAVQDIDPRFITPSVFYRIEEDRIVRNDELRYFDHPKFGVLAKIMRIEEDEPEEPDTTDDLLPGNVTQ